MTRLSERQAEILQLIGQGKSNKEIAHALGLTTGTVKQHVYALFRKLGVRNRTTAAARSAEIARDSAPDRQPAAAVAVPSTLPEALRYARRLVTAVVIEPRPAPARNSREASSQALQVAALRARIEHLAFAFDARSEALAGGGVAAWFGQAAAHGDDAERAVAFVRVLAAGTKRGVAHAAGIGTVAEVVGETAGESIAYRTFRLATLLASLAEPASTLACDLTCELAGLKGAPAGPPDARSGIPLGAQVVGPAPPPRADAAAQWGGLPFVEELAGKLRRGSCQWLGVESWPPEAGTRLIDAIGEVMAARGLPARSLWMPAASSAGNVSARLTAQLRDAAPGQARHQGELARALAESTAAGPAVLLAYGIDALEMLKRELGAQGLEALRRLPLLVVAGAMHRTGAPQTSVRLLGANPGAPPFVRVLRMRVPQRAGDSLRGMRPDVQAVLDAVSVEARAVARVAANPDTNGVEAIARALDMAPDAVVARCRELETYGLLSVSDGQLRFRDAMTADAVRASLA